MEPVRPLGITPSKELLTTTITIIGTGNMAHAIGGVLVDGGASVQYVGHGENTPVQGDIVILAVPYPAVDDIISRYGDQLAGKTVVDITNPVDFSTFNSLVVPAGSSAAAEIQAKLPDSAVVKAFNTTFAGTLTSRRIGELTTTVLLAGDDVEAKTALIAAIEAGGLAAVDVGSLQRAHELEAVGFLQLALAAGEKISWNGGLGLIR